MGIALVVVVLDQVSKWRIVDSFGPESNTHRSDLIGSFVGFEYVKNSGAAFGLFQGQTWLLSVLSVVVAGSFLIGFASALPYNSWLRLSAALVLGGAVGNLVDRVRLGFVVDFIAVGTWHRFNVADASITVGLTLLGWVVLTQYGNEDSPL